MALLQKVYRENLESEDIQLVGLYIDDKWKYQKESVPIPKLKRISNHAVVIGNGMSGREFDLTKFLPSRVTTPWGETTPWVSRKQTRSFLTYGCNAIYRDFQTDFTIVTGDAFVDEISKSGYCETNYVYTNTKYLEKYPGKFNYIPQNPEYNAGAIAAYLAAFDGHKKIYMLGFDGIDNKVDNYNVYAGTTNYPLRTDSINEEFWIRSLDNIMKVYSDTEFIRVAPTKKFRQPEIWKYNLNYRQIDFRQFVLEADV